MKSTVLSPSRPSTTLRLGFVGLSDAAPLIVAKEKGYFTEAGLHIELSREVGWATVRDKVLTGELFASHAPAPMLWAARLGINGVAFPAATGLVLNLHGNALCLSNRLRVWGVHDARSLRLEALRRRGERKLVFGVVYPFSAHNLHLRAWLRSAGLVADRDVRVVIVPPAQMLQTLSAGVIDGFMAGEPWTSMAVHAGEGWCPAWSGALFPGHVEKVLMAREERCASPEYLAIGSAVLRACAWCDESHNREELAELLSRNDYIKLPVSILRNALCGPFDFGQGRSEAVTDFLIFHKGGANVPTRERALSLQRDLQQENLIGPVSEEQFPSEVFREDLFRKIEAMLPLKAHR